MSTAHGALLSFDSPAACFGLLGPPLGSLSTTHPCTVSDEKTSGHQRNNAIIRADIERMELLAAKDSQLKWIQLHMRNGVAFHQYIGMSTVTKHRRTSDGAQ